MAVDYDILNRTSDFAGSFAAGMQDARQNSLLRMQQDQARVEANARQSDLLYKQALGQFLGQDTVNTLLTPEAQAARQEQQNALMQMNPQATMQALQAQGAMRAQADADRERATKERQDVALRVTRGAQLAMESQAPGRYIKTQYPDLVAELEKSGKDVSAMTDDDWRATAKDLYDEFSVDLAPTFGINPQQELRNQGTRLKLDQQSLDLRERELKARGANGNTGTGAADELDQDTLELAVADVMVDPKQMLNYARYKNDTAKRTQINKAIAAKLKESGMSPNDLIRLRAGAAGEKKSIADMTKQVNAISNFEELAKFNGNRVLELLDQVDDTGVPWIEGVTRRIKRGGGDVDAAELQSVLTPFQTEVARIITNPNLVGVLSDSARHEVQEMAAGNMSAKQAKRIINRMFTEMEFRRNSISERIKQAGTNMTGETGLNAVPNAAPPAGGGGGWTIEPAN